MYQLIFLGLITLASTHDLNVGANAQGKKIFDEKFQASPAIWRQKQNVTVNTTDDEVISRVVVTDLREEKDGDVKIVDGGEGQNTVTIELQSPTVLRGFDFQVEVYAAPSDQLGKVNPQNNGNLAHPSQTKAQENVLNKRNTDLNLSSARTNLDATTKTPDSTDSKKVLLLSSKDNQTTDNPRRVRDTETKEQHETKAFNPSDIKPQDDTTANNKDVPNAEKPRTFTIGVPSSSIDKSDDSVTRTPSLLGRDFKTNSGEVRHARDTENEGDFKQRTPVTQNAQNQHKHVEDDETSSTRTEKPRTFTIGVSSSSTDKSDDSVTRTPSLLGRNFKTNNGEVRHTRDTEKEGGFKQRTPVTQNAQNEHKHAEDDETNTPAVPKFVALNNENDTSRHSVPTTDGPKGFRAISRNSSPRKERDTNTEQKDINVPRVLTDTVKNPPKINNKNAVNVTNEQPRNSRSTENEGVNVPSTFGLKDHATSTTTVAPKVLTSGQESSTEKPQISGNSPRTFPRAQNYPAPYPYITTPRVSTTTNSQQKRDTETSEKDLTVKDNDNDWKYKSLESVNATTNKAPVISIQ